MGSLKAKPLPTDLSFHGLFAPNSTYHYFKDAESQSFRHNSNKFQSVNAWWLAECSLLAYVRDHAFVSQALASAGLPQTRFFENNGTQCFVAHNDNFAIVCFRGTEVGEVQDILTDLNLPLTNNDERGQVHSGFKNALDQVWNRGDCNSHNLLEHINTITEANSELKIWFTGHSLGAALATLAADRFPEAQGLYTFGSPRVGDREFAWKFETTAYRFVNNNDIVTMVPPAISYQHVGLLKYIDDTGHIHDNPTRWITMKSRITGHLGYLGEVLNSWSHGNLSAIPVDYLNDHAPIYYAVYIWNNHLNDME
ncbi:triacylglycerol lipase [Mariprofundus aestuarium]|uniref:Triacylglycerol lipase n=1 Tax=Mariprofundus aestuarium TaxID=1921086 RepID=A0A2K8KY09_MARES|nr:lipase family protein [Mariprofundus aestuarium]ATX79855.1 triacylglycerol lipase [Mariprofundus aestuarium]